MGHAMDGIAGLSDYERLPVWGSVVNASVRVDQLRTERVERTLANSPLMRFLRELEHKATSGSFDLEAALDSTSEDPATASSPASSPHSDNQK